MHALYGWARAARSGDGWVFLEPKNARAETTVSAKTPSAKPRWKCPSFAPPSALRAKEPSYQLLQFDRSISAPQIAAILGLPPNTIFVFIEAVYLSDNVPYQFERRWLVPKAVPKLQEINIQAAPVDEWLLEKRPP